MAKLKIRIYPDPILKAKVQNVTDFGPAAQKLFDDMIETMYSSDGVGLAATQVGISKNIFVASPTMRQGGEFVFVNAVIEKKEGAVSAAEGCLSFPGFSAEIVRASKVEVGFQDRLGEKHRIVAVDFFARIIQHEMDHLSGKTLVDHFSGAEREKILEQYKSLSKSARGRAEILEKYKLQSPQ